MLGFPGESDSKESACNVGDLDLIPGLGRSPVGWHGNHSSIGDGRMSCLENRHVQRSLEVYRPGSRKESD